MSVHDWQFVAAIFAAVFVVAIALLIVAVSCLDLIAEELEDLRGKAARRIHELEQEQAR